MNSAFFNFYLGSLSRIFLMLVIGFPALRYISSLLAKICSQRFSRHIGVLVSHIVFYGGVIFIAVNVLHECGFNVTALVGAAGVVGVAIGFASQTSISNIISGFFLLIERPFSVGDTIKSGDVLGVAESIDLLAVRVRTLDNKLVRIPNEMVLKHSLTNLTYYPIKRIDLLISVSYAQSYQEVKNVVFGVVEKEKLFLAKPTPIVLFNKVAQQDYGTEMRNFFSVRVWVNKDQFSVCASLLIDQLKSEFDKIGFIVTITALN